MNSKVAAVVDWQWVAYGCNVINYSCTRVHSLLRDDVGCLIDWHESERLSRHALPDSSKYHLSIGLDVDASTATFAMVKALAFKGDKKPIKKRKRLPNDNKTDDDPTPTSNQLITTTPAAPTEDPDDTHWVSADSLPDITGPILLVLSATPPTTLSFDALGAVFPQKIENLVEGLPDSAEPHDIRQVWIATRVVGSEGSFTFKGHQGRYLGCDKYGVCSASREAVSAEETFALQAVEGNGRAGCFRVKTAWGTFLSAKSSESQGAVPVVRGDATEAETEVEADESTFIRVRMQARFKPIHKVEKAEKMRAKISRKELEEEVGRRLEDDEVRRLKKARREGDYHEVMLDVKVKGKHDKFA
ncbi:hypothetical protein B0A54_03741 [Friedmanniomyces endolithicus]|uniref:FRG1-like family protein n=2 Tax=Friedmanniomyces endolithicus TaxID=329885 RepID=A0A4U0VF73_9PEZI|nr:hypothetical protein B0A54_03741 [Friedmanniomyces endolithicus]